MLGLCGWHPFSSRLIDGKETFNVAARSFCSQRSKALAACTCSLVIMPWSQDQLAMCVVHLEKPKPRRQATSCLLRAPCSACDHLRLGRARLMAVGIDVGDSG